MVNQAWKKGKILAAGACCAAALTLLAVAGCGTSSYDEPRTTQTERALLDPAQLKQWMEDGLVNRQEGNDKVVILEVSGSPAGYNAGHIPGAIFVNLNELTANRVEGPAEFGSMVATGAQMDTLIKRAGIDQNTTIVFTTSAADMDGNRLWMLTRGYATFRYWGFPKERLKVLDGGNKSWPAAGGTFTAAVPVVAASNYGVTPSGVNRVQDDLRASLAEMMAAVAAGDKDFVDGRPSITGGTQDLSDTTKYVVFEGRLKNSNFNGTSTVPNSRVLAYTALVGADKRFKPLNEFVDVNDVDADGNTTETLAGVRELLNIQSDTAYTLCRAGNIASVLFFAIDGYAYHDGSKKAVWYDGSWGQWGLMATSDTLSRVRGVNAGGKLPVGSPWSTLALTDLQADLPGNTTTVSTSAAYNVDFVTSPLTDPPTFRQVMDITAPGTGLPSRLLPIAPPADANQVEEADRAYRSAISSTGGGGASGGGGC